MTSPSPSSPSSSGDHRARYVVILGTNEIASAVAVRLHQRGYGVVMSHDPLPPVIRRKMAFHDALFDDPVVLAGVTAQRADNGVAVVAGLRQRGGVVITDLGLLDLMVIRSLDVLIDARLQKYQSTPDLRRLAQFTIGLGPGFTAGANCDFAIETKPSKEGALVRRGATEPADGVVRRLGERGAERFVYSASPGRWHSAMEIGSRVFKDYIVGYLAGDPVAAPFDGILRGVVRDGMEVPAGVKLLEVDPRMRGAVWSGIEDRAQTIARAVEGALALRDTPSVLRPSFRAVSPADDR
ncbi:xanthine dehydrogenase [Azospirillum sp. B4]|uniref:xanthine dehydrogenase n=1 Tax=Azospirillum sp. B4 TaxID=95605 RepID=UPI0005CA8D98|nr:xanthine dehydrogenase [Azospirillum sp. B4]